MVLLGVQSLRERSSATKYKGRRGCPFENQSHGLLYENRDYVRPYENS
ncbi:hypothetical protein NPIL_311051, partial [Nephila pilipes]